MNSNNYYTIKSIIDIQFKNSKLRDICYNSFLPEYNLKKAKRSTLTMEKKENSLIFHIESNDITAFRATITEIISFGKVFDNSIKIVELS